MRLLFPLSPVVCALSMLGLSACNNDGPTSVITQISSTVTVTAPPTPVTGPTWFGDVRSVVEKYCTNCHRDGGSAISFEDPETLRRLRSVAARRIREEHSPPWPPLEGFRALEGARSLAGEDRLELLAWLEGDAPLGEATDDIPAIDSVSEGAYDLELEAGDTYQPLAGAVRCFVLPWPGAAPAHLRQIELFLPGDGGPSQALVALTEAVDIAAFLEADAADGESGWDCGGAPGLPGAGWPRPVGTWTNNGAGLQLPHGASMALEPGAAFLVQVNFGADADTPVTPRLRLSTSADTDRALGAGFVAGGERSEFTLAAGDRLARVEYRFPALALALQSGAQAGIAGSDDYALHAVGVWMNQWGRRTRVILERADGVEEVLLAIDAWQPRWRGLYRFQRPVEVGSGDWLRLECGWDNRSDAPVTSGYAAADENCLLGYQLTATEEHTDRTVAPTLYIASPHYGDTFAPGDYVPLRLRANNFHLHEPAPHSHDNGMADMGHSGMDHSGMHSGMTDHGGMGAAGDGHSEMGDGHGEMSGADMMAGGDHGGHGGHGGMSGTAAPNQGHYHAYLNTLDDAADHLTAWDTAAVMKLPDDIESGDHFLWVNLRDDNHQPLGIEARVDFRVDGAGSSESLVNLPDWLPVSPTLDRFMARRPDAIPCGQSAWMEESGTLSVLTGDCNYVALSQPSAVALEAGDSLRWVLWHSALAGPATANAHVALVVADELLWSRWVALPTESGVYAEDLPVPVDVPAGVEIQWYVYAPGAGRWTLLELSRRR